MHHPALKAYTMMEVIVTLVLISIMAALIVPKVLSSRSANDDSIAKQSLVAAVDDETTIFGADGAFTADPARLAKVDNQRSFIDAASEPSGPGEVSVVLNADGTTLGFATKGSYDSCWMLLKKFETGGSELQEIWAIADSPDSLCTGQRALELVPGLDSNDGSNSSRPVRLP